MDRSIAGMIPRVRHGWNGSPPGRGSVGGAGDRGSRSEDESDGRRTTVGAGGTVTEAKVRGSGPGPGGGGSRREAGDVGRPKP